MNRRRARAAAPGVRRRHAAPASVTARSGAGRSTSFPSRVADDHSNHGMTGDRLHVDLMAEDSDMERFFAANSYCVLEVGSENGLTAAEAQHWAQKFDDDRATPGWRLAYHQESSTPRGPGGGDMAAFGWTDKGGTREQTVNGDVLLTSPVFDGLIRHPKIIAAVERIMGGKCALAETCLRHMMPFDGREHQPYQHWHRDGPPGDGKGWDGQPPRRFRAEYIQAMVLLSDTDATTHCFSLSPEACDEEPLPSDPSETGGVQVTQRGALDMHGPTGTVVLLNLSTLHTATARITTKERKTMQTYYGHAGGRTLSQFTCVPPAFWRDHEDDACRAFYSGLPLNDKSRAVLSLPPRVLQRPSIHADRSRL
eukprot:COSAG02_NODE_2302_length_9186_cov_25.811269_3_plen_367_part_00